MDSVYQRLKEMDPDQFQRFCAQLLKEKHQGQEIKHIEGAGHPTRRHLGRFLMLSHSRPVAKTPIERIFRRVMHRKMTKAERRYFLHKTRKRH